MTEANKILPCTCESKFQDKEYGKGKRLFNLSQSPKKKEAHCTVCGKVVYL